jgi:hypothetical protein
VDVTPLQVANAAIYCVAPLKIGFRRAHAFAWGLSRELFKLSGENLETDRDSVLRLARKALERIQVHPQAATRLAGELIDCFLPGKPAEGPDGQYPAGQATSSSNAEPGTESRKRKSSPDAAGSLGLGAATGARAAGEEEPQPKHRRSGEARRPSVGRRGSEHRRGPGTRVGSDLGPEEDRSPTRRRRRVPSGTRTGRTRVGVPGGGAGDRGADEAGNRRSRDARKQEGSGPKRPARRLREGRVAGDAEPSGGVRALGLPRTGSSRRRSENRRRQRSRWRAEAHRTQRKFLGFGDRDQRAPEPQVPANEGVPVSIRGWYRSQGSEDSEDSTDEFLRNVNVAEVTAVATGRKDRRNPGAAALDQASAVLQIADATVADEAQKTLVGEVATPGHQRNRPDQVPAGRRTPVLQPPRLQAQAADHQPRGPPRPRELQEPPVQPVPLKPQPPQKPLTLAETGRIRPAPIPATGTEASNIGAYRGQQTIRGALETAAQTVIDRWKATSLALFTLFTHFYA